MGLSTPVSIIKRGVTNKAQYNIFEDDIELRDRLLRLFPDYQVDGLECSCLILLGSANGCQVRIDTTGRNGEYNDFLAGSVYGMDGNSLVKGVVLSSNNIEYTIRITF